jgi:hypothetical protein
VQQNNTFLFMKSWSDRAVENGPFASLRSIALLQRTARVRFRSSICRAPCNWTLLTGPKNRFSMPIKE